MSFVQLPIACGGWFLVGGPQSYCASALRLGLLQFQARAFVTLHVEQRHSIVRVTNIESFCKLPAQLLKQAFQRVITRGRVGPDFRVSLNPPPEVC